MDLYAAFIDLIKAFDTVSQGGLWKILDKLVCPPKFLSSFSNSMKASRVKSKIAATFRTPSPLETA